MLLTHDFDLYKTPIPLTSGSCEWGDHGWSLTVEHGWWSLPQQCRPIERGDGLSWSDVRHHVLGHWGWGHGYNKTQNWRPGWKNMLSEIFLSEKVGIFVGLK